MHAQAIVISLTLCCLFSACQQQSPDRSVENRQQEQDLNSPKGAEVFSSVIDYGFFPLQVLTHDREQVFTLPSGAVITVPAYCFTDARGNRVTSRVDLTFREFHDAASIIAAGIGMKTLLPSGDTGMLETAGMFELLARTNGETTHIAPGKTIQVSLMSAVGGTYDTWRMNEETGLWDNRLEPNTPVVAQTSPRPAAKSSDDLVIADLDLSKTPELQGIKDLRLSFADENPALAPSKNTWITDPGIWAFKSLTPTPEKGFYVLSLIGEEEYRIRVRVNSGQQNKVTASAEFDEELTRLNRIGGISPEARNFRFQRNMKINQFGLFNYDIILSNDSSRMLAADFNFGDISPKDRAGINLYHITANGRAVFDLDHITWRRIPINTAVSNYFVALLPDGRIATFSAKQFKQLGRKLPASYVFDMDYYAGDIRDFKDFKALVDQLGV